MSELNTAHARIWQLSLWVHWLADGGTWLRAAHALGYWPRADLISFQGVMTPVERNLLASALAIDASGDHLAGCRICRNATHLDLAKAAA